MSRFNAKISLTGRTHRVNISTVGDRIHLTSLPVLLLLFSSFTLILSRCICLRLKVEKAGFFFSFWNHVNKRKGKGLRVLPLPSPDFALTMRVCEASCNSFEYPWFHRHLPQLTRWVAVNLELKRQVKG